VLPADANRLCVSIPWPEPCIEFAMPAPGKQNSRWTEERRDGRNQEMCERSVRLQADRRLKVLQRLLCGSGRTDRCGLPLRPCNLQWRCHKCGSRERRRSNRLKPANGGWILTRWLIARKWVTGHPLAAQRSPVKPESQDPKRNGWMRSETQCRFAATVASLISRFAWSSRSFACAAWPPMSHSFAC
jgi:hypothetical protein